MPIKVNYMPPRSTTARVAGSMSGWPIRTATKLATWPLGLSDLFTNLVADKYAGTPEETKLKEYFQKNYGVSNGTERPNAEKFVTDKFLQPTLGKLLPEGALYATKPEEKFLDNASATALTLPMMGTKAIGGALPYLMQVAKSIPAAAGEQVGQNLASGMKFGLPGQMIGGILGLLTGQGAMNVAESGLKNLPSAIKNYGAKQLERNMPMAKEFGQEITAENRLAAQRSAEQEALTKELENYNVENLAGRQEEMDILKRRHEEEKLRAKEAEQVSKQVAKFNAVNLTEDSKLDAEVLKRREQNARSIDKLRAENNTIMSKADAERLKKLNSEGSPDFQKELDDVVTKIRTQSEGTARQIEDLQTHEALVMDKYGARPKEIRNRINNLHDEFESSIHTGADTSANKLEAINKINVKRLGSPDVSGPSYDFLWELVNDTRKVIKNGRISVEELGKLQAKINDRIAHIRKTRDLVGLENKYVEYNNAIKEIMNNVKTEHPHIKTEKWFEANKLTRDLYQNAEASKWVNNTFQHFGLGWVSKILKQPALYARSPQVSKYVNNAVAHYLKKDMAQATKNLITADKVAERELGKEQNINLMNKPQIPKAQITKITFK
jgi:hypothetical protein